MVGLRTLGIGGAQEKATPKERRGGVADFDLDVLRLGHGGWVVERGINLCARSLKHYTFIERKPWPVLWVRNP
jgi:hypothetical protein